MVRLYWARDWLVDFADGDEIVLCHNGDITNGDRHGGNIPETTREDQRIIARDNMRPYLQLPNVKKARLMTGTAVHVPECAEARVAHHLRREMGKDVQSCHHARFTIDSEVVEVAHHGAYPGSRDWLRGNVALYHLKDRIYRDRRSGLTPARVYAYGHFHQRVYATVKDTWVRECYQHDLVIVPAFSGLDDYVRKGARSPPIIQAGIVVLEFVDSKLRSIQEFIKEQDLRKEEKL